MVKTERITKLNDLLRLVEESIEAAEGPRWFRGAGNVSHKLLPSLYRHPQILDNTIDPMQMEQRLQARFMQTSPPFLENRPGTKLEWLFTAQHFGVPTRLLDWSENPFIALYFALSSTAAGAEPCVWMLDPMLWTRKSLNNPRLVRIPDPLDTASTRFMESLDGDLDPRYDPIAIFSSHNNPRIVAQRGTFTLFGKGQKPMEEIEYAQECLRCFVIPEPSKDDLYKKLLAIGYTHSVVYPDLSGLGRELKTYFNF